MELGCQPTQYVNVFTERCHRLFDFASTFRSLSLWQRGAMSYGD